ncbi:hypothetical protein E2L06_16440 [Haloterrigena sp. H1]|uniref:hypothetical protein n=1 Tax=Haloterrigena sp. H1 TaxID=2552943 RepID=UPI00110F5623|nr:hypothetical protein [Haloterrigena sp. H1]TMT81548.1 hypothetical protein E2L06_16440 [Haloterrigena sp. H1]
MRIRRHVALRDTFDCLGATGFEALSPVGQDAVEGIAIVTGLIARLEESVDGVLEGACSPDVTAESLGSICSVSRTVSG